MYLLCFKEWSLGYFLGRGNLLCCVVVLYVGKGSAREQCCLLSFHPALNHLPGYPQANWALLVLIPRWMDFVYVLGLCGSLQQTLLWDWEFFLLLKPPTEFYSQRFWGFSSPHWNPGLRGLSYSQVVPPSLSACKCGTIRWASCHLAVGPLHPSCLSPPLLPVWMKVSSLTPWLLDFHTVQFSGSSGSFCFKISCCPSFDCARKQSMSTYTSLPWLEVK